MLKPHKNNLQRHYGRLHVDLPCYTVASIASIVDENYHSVYRWTQTSQAKTPSVTTCDVEMYGDNSVPFVGLVEAYVISLLRKTGLPIRDIRPALERLNSEFGIEHALASDRLRSDGAKVLCDFGINNPELVVLRNNHRVFNGILENFLQDLGRGSRGF